MAQNSTYDITMDDGMTIKNVPSAYTRAQVTQLYRAQQARKSANSTYDITMADGTVIKNVPKNYSRDQVVQLYRAQQARKSAGTIGPAMPFVRAGATPQTTEKSLYKWIPSAAGIAASLALGPEVGIPLAALGTGLAGAGGKVIETAAEGNLGSQSLGTTANQAARSGLTQGLTEFGGRLLGPIASRILAGRGIPEGVVAGHTVKGSEVGSLAERAGMKMSLPELTQSSLGLNFKSLGEMGMLGQRIGAAAQKQTKAAAEEFADQVANTLAKQRTPAQSGAMVQDALSQANQAFKKKASDLWENKLKLLGRRAPANFRPLIGEAKREYDVPPFVIRKTAGVGEGGKGFGGFLRTVETTLPEPPKVPALLDTIMHLKPDGTFADALAIKQYLDRFTPGSGQAFADPGSARIAKLFEKRLFAVMSKSADDSGGPLKDQWEQARKFYSEGREAYNNKLVKKLMERKPEMIAKSIKPGDVTNVEMVKRALLEHGKDTAAWNTFRRQYIQSNLLGSPDLTWTGDIFKLKDKLNAAGSEQLKSIFGGDAQGKWVLHDMRILAEATSRVHPVRQHAIARIIEATAPVTAFFRPEAAALELAGIEGGPFIISRIIYSPTATRLFVNGINLSATNTGLAAANITRAIDIALRMNDKERIPIDTNQLRRKNGAQTNQVSAR